MHSHHKTLLAEIKTHQRRRSHSQANDSYLSSGHDYYDVSVPARRAMSKAWLKANRGIADKEFIAVLDSLVQGKSHEEKTVACILLAYHAPGRAAAGPKKLNAWLDHLVGWAEIDSLCQNVYPAEEVLDDWKRWEVFVRKLSRDKNINKRRAALVLLTGPVRYSADKRLAVLAFEVVETLKGERDIIITKAVSWLLRSLTENHKRAVADYINRNRQSLPAIAVRETTRKIETGRK
jgi:3-methyladenine DNA glycosylase AlkD